MVRQGDTLVLARRMPARMDVAAETRLAAMPRLRLARQVRQDVWRALQRVRGFSPVIEVHAEGDGLRLVAGGQVDGAVPPGASAAIAAVLEDRDNRARWARHAGRGR
ncbi:hypothetical protein OG2516_00324 [Oceanicola granulosus HTCC2516]|uniref:Uncharacterized protein n=1 Tax=Oceanicola granulosus (strain ATCC BAA-861 / DSM 15982 / KCTC 12143 / HTCC2516) TaxID=314256 RepID=Q2C9Z0_OCEGH|nr:hypothetical protein OG2516_00324 [Oceanicola granulosus HTCC2516]